jgi:hypothetical protein
VKNETFKSLARVFGGFAAIASVPILFSGCIAYKIETSDTPQPATTTQWQPHYSFTLCVQIPKQDKLNELTNSQDWLIDPSLYEMDAYLLAGKLADCRLFNKVVISGLSRNNTIMEDYLKFNRDKNVKIENLSDNATNVLFVRVLPTDPPEWSTDPMALYFCTVMPIYESWNSSVHFKFVQNHKKEFDFPWKQQLVIGFWAPVVAVFGSNWHLTTILPGSSAYKINSQYQSLLRSDLIREIDQVNAENKLGH